MEPAVIPNLFLDRETSDIQIHVDTLGSEPAVVLPGHSLVLQRASEVFKKMLETGRFKESCTGVVKLTVNGSVHDAIHFLRYLYSGQLKHQDIHVCLSLIQIAHMYGVTSLVKLCSKRIAKALTAMNVCRIYVLIQNFASQETLDKCKELMLQTAFIIFMNDLHLPLKEETMEYLLRSDSLNVLNEEQALGALWRWGCTRLALENSAADKSLHQCISKLLPLIRWNCVNSIKETDPWFALLEVVAVSGDAQTQNVERKATANWYQILRFSEVFCLVATPPYKEIKLTGGSISNILIFTVDRDILLLGLSFQVTVSERFQSKFPFGLILNYEEVKEVTFRERLLFVFPGVSSSSVDREGFKASVEKYVKENAEYGRMSFNFSDSATLLYSLERSIKSTVVQKSYTYELTVNFVTPLPVRGCGPSILELIVLQEPNINVRLLSFNVDLETGSDFEERAGFKVHESVSVVQKLFYFTKL